jgi:hypothetical protein
MYFPLPMKFYTQNICMYSIYLFQYNIIRYTQNYWVFGLCPSSVILETRKHNVSETGSVSVLM